MTELSTSPILLAAPTGAVEEPVINQTVWAAVRGLWEQGVAKKAIARQLNLDIKTVRKWVQQAWHEQKRCRRGRQLDEWDAFLRARAPEVGFNGAVLARELVAKGYAGTYSSVVKHIAPWRAAWRPEEEPTVRFETGPGQQSQVDWGQAWIYLGEERVKVHLFVMVLGFSRRAFARAYLSEGVHSLLDAHAAAFEHLGGRTETILYDNPRTIVSSKNEEAGTVVWNGTFKDRMDFYGATIRLCRFYRAQTKGKVENGVKYVKRNALAGRRFRDLDELNAWLLEWCLTVADQRVHGTTREKPAERFARAERLIPVDQRPPGARECIETRRVPNDAYVAVETNRYPVSFDWVGREVEVHLLCERIEIRSGAGEPVSYVRLEGKYKKARWQGSARVVPKRDAVGASGPPRFDPVYAGLMSEVEVRSLAQYEEVAR